MSKPLRIGLVMIAMGISCLIASDMVSTSTQAKTSVNAQVIQPASCFTDTTVYFGSVQVPKFSNYELILDDPADLVLPAELSQGLGYCIIGDRVIRLINPTKSDIETGETRWTARKFH